MPEILEGLMDHAAPGSAFGQTEHFYLLGSSCALLTAAVAAAAAPVPLPLLYGRRLEPRNLLLVH